jgi:penicillin-binding protein 1A
MGVGVWVGFDQPKTIAPEAYGARFALPIWSDFMRQALRHRPAGSFTPPATLHEEPLCRISYLRPVDGCPTYDEYFKEGDQIPGRLCSVHRGSIKQRVRRAMEGFLSGLGRRIGRIFR